MQFLERFYHASIFVPQRVKTIKNKDRNFALTDSLVLLAVLLFVGYSWHFAMIFEGFARVSGGAGLSELLYFIRQLVILDIIPLVAIATALKFTSGLPGWGKNVELAVAIWIQPVLIRLVMEGIPLIFPRMNYYPLPLVEIPQLVAYMWGLLSFSFALSCCKSRKKRPKKGKGVLFHKNLSYVWAVLILAGASLLYWYPLARAMPIFIKAPAFVLPSTEGKSCDLSKEKGKVVLVEFWSTRCHHCRKQVAEMKELADEMDPDKMTIFAIHTSAHPRYKKEAQAMLQHKNITHCFDDGAVSSVYRDLSPYHRLRGIPHTMIIDRHGIIRKVIRGRKDAAIIQSHLKRILAR